MEALIIYPRTKEDESLYKQLAKRLQNHIETTKVESPYDVEFIKKIERGESAAKSGKTGMKVNLEGGLWK